jgi:sortase A
MRLLSSILVAVGLLLILIATAPILTALFQDSLTPHLTDPTETSPFTSSIKINLTQASDWFIPAVNLPPPAISPVTYFTLSIPRLKLTNVPVEINGSDLKKNAIHYPGTAFPGDFGNTVVFGHSALPQFYRAGNPLTIFNPIVKAKLGDQIIVDYDHLQYTYQVTRITETTASQIEVLAQNYDRRQLTLITCTPLGTYWRRFVVRAEIL